MSKLIVIAGFGPGTASAVADTFGSHGFAVALLARNEERLAGGVSRLSAAGVKAAAFPANAADPASVRAAIADVRSQMGPIHVLFWNLYGGLEAGDLLAADLTAVRQVFDAPVFGLLAAVREALPDLRTAQGAVLVSNGGLAEISPGADKAAGSQFMGLALSSAAKHKLVGLLAERLRDDHVFVGEVVVHGVIGGAQPNVTGTIEPSTIAEKHWELYEGRAETYASVFPPNAGAR